MCGIVGYIGSENGIQVTVKGLERLEYRGYDSAGISFLGQNGIIETYKAKGELAQLKKVIASHDQKSSLAIGHTRWATHGVVNEINAHPHENQDFSIVHNGIIENASQIKEEMKSIDYKFNSETDTEVFLSLITKFYHETQSVRKAIFQAFEKVQGNSAFVVIHKKTQKIWSIKKNAPLVCGLNTATKEKFISSDPYALVGFAHKVYFPENGVLVELSADDVDIDQHCFFENETKNSHAYLVKDLQKNIDISEKGTFDHYMHKEIYEQPLLISSLINKYSSPELKDLLNKIEFSKSVNYIIGCGTALHAGRLLETIYETYSDLTFVCDYASEFRYKNKKISKDDLGLFISQSGETADTLACLDMVRENNAQVVSIVNVEGSTIFRNSDHNLLVYAGQEIGVASTKAFTQQVLTGLLLLPKVNAEIKFEDIIKEYQLLSHRIDKLIKNNESQIIEVAKKLYQMNGYIFTGRRELFPIALEGALKLKEIAYVHAEGYASGELKHGPISLIDENMVNVVLATDALYEKTLSNAQEVKARGGVIIGVGSQDKIELKQISDHYIEVESKDLKYTFPVLANVVLQLLSYHIAKLKGTDIDKPRNLAKSVTVE